MSDNKPGFLFSTVHNIGDGHQVQVTFNLHDGATSKDIDAKLDDVFTSVKRQSARLRVPTIEMEVGMQDAKIRGIEESIARMEIGGNPKLVSGRRSSAEDAQFKQAQTQLDADKARLELLKKNLELTYKEADLPVTESPCLIRAAN